MISHYCRVDNALTRASPSLPSTSITAHDNSTQMAVNSIVGSFFFSASFQEELLFGLLIFHFYIASYTVACSKGSYCEISLPNLISAALSFLFLTQRSSTLEEILDPPRISLTACQLPITATVIR